MERQVLTFVIEPQDGEGVGTAELMIIVGDVSHHTGIKADTVREVANKFSGLLYQLNRGQRRHTGRSTD